MEAFVITGGNKLEGRISISGSKNSALPIMAASLLSSEPMILQDVPNLRDIKNMRALLKLLGCDVCDLEAGAKDSAIRLQVTEEEPCWAKYDIVCTMRASICVLGPLLAKRGKARVSMPGGCAIGERPVDIHLRGLEALGARITLEDGDIIATTDKLKGTTIYLGGPFGSTVLGTANVMSAAALAEGTTIIECAACEPEIVDLANVLNAMGAKIAGAGTPRISIEGVEKLHTALEHRIIADRIEAGTYIIAAAITGGELVLDNCPLDSLLALVDLLGRVGVEVNQADLTEDKRRCLVKVKCADNKTRPRPVQLTTQPYPGFPTDLQAQMMALLSMADGNSVVTERIFPERFLHVAELGRMGARLYRQGPTVIVSGVDNLIGAPVTASDLRASASLVLAGLAAKGRTIVRRVYHLDRGYEQMEKKLEAVGADIHRVNVDETSNL